MATHVELSSVVFHEGKYRFCLDRVIDGGGSDRSQYAFVWRGSKVSSDAFVPRPAYFDFGLLGRTIRIALDNGSIKTADLDDLLHAVMKIETDK